jgi:hypothetical protein
VHELDGLRVVSAKGYERFTSLVCMTPAGEYRKLELYFDAEYRTCKKVWKGTSENSELNMAILPKGVCATIVRDGELVIFVPSNDEVARISDKDASTDVILSNWENKVVFIRDGQLWQVAVA